MNLTGQNVRQKERKASPDAAYLERVRQGPCEICNAFGEVQIGPTFAHHPIMGRYSGRKAPDRTAIGLCYAHHQSQSPGACSVHHHRAEFRRRYGNDTDYISIAQDRANGELT